MQKPQIIIGNKNYSSWSLRAWLPLAKLEIDFEEVYIPLFSEGYKARILAHSPAGRVPIYIDGDLAIWDTLAIAEYLAEQHPQLWPADVAERAHARAIAAEMHAGFATLRELMPMNCRATGRRVASTDALSDDIARIQQIWEVCRQRHAQAGPWLFGTFTIADALYAPVVSRFHTYGVTCDALGTRYMQTVLGDPAMQKWFAAAREEKEVIEVVEVGL